MDFAENTLVVLHFIGLASLLGGFLVQISTSPRVVNNAMLHGAITQLVTGLLLVGIAESEEAAEVDHAKVGTKLVVLIVILVLILVNRKKDSVSTAVWGAIGGLTILNIVLAVFW
jgi:hypothetical protein